MLKANDYVSSWIENFAFELKLYIKPCKMPLVQKNAIMLNNSGFAKPNEQQMATKSLLVLLDILFKKQIVNIFSTFEH